MAFCSASTEDAIRGSELVAGNHRSTACTKDAGRLVCVGYNADGTVTIKGLAVSNLAETFRLHFTEVPTCVRVASRRPVLAVGFADGALNAISFEGDRCADACGSRWSSSLGPRPACAPAFVFRVFRVCAAGCVLNCGIFGTKQTQQ